MCHEKSILYDNWWWSVLRLRRSSKALPKAKLPPKKGHCLVFCCLSDPLQLSESRWKHYIWEVCSANWWDATKTAKPADNIDQQNGSSSSPWQHLTTGRTTNASKVECIGLWNFASSTIFPQPLTNLLHFFKHLDNFLQGKCFHNQQDSENAFQEFIESQSMYFYAIGKNKFISQCKNVLIVMVPFLINKGVFEPSYNDLKFTVLNYSYTGTNIN